MLQRLGDILFPPAPAPPADGLPPLHLVVAEGVLTIRWTPSGLEWEGVPDYVSTETMRRIKAAMRREWLPLLPLTPKTDSKEIAGRSL